MAKSLAQVISSARIRAGLSQHALAREVGIAANHLARIESGTKALPRFDTVARLAAALGLSLDDVAAELGYVPTAVGRPLEPGAAKHLVSDLLALRERLAKLDGDITPVVAALTGSLRQKRPRGGVKPVGSSRPRPH